MKIRNILLAGILLTNLVSLGCATARSDELRSRLSEKDWQYCCYLNNSPSPARFSHIP
jgi:hypothetical protein